MKIANYSWLMVVLFFSAASLSAQVVDDSRIPPPPPVTQEEVAAPAPTDAGAISTTDTTAPVAPAEPAMQTAQETSDSIVITHESREAQASPDAATGGEELPTTASPLALLALLGAGSSGAAFGLRALRRRG